MYENNYTFVQAILNRAKIRTQVLWGWGNGFRVGRKYRVMVCVVKVVPEPQPPKIKRSFLDRVRFRMGKPGRGSTLSAEMLRRATHVHFSDEDIRSGRAAYEKMRASWNDQPRD